MMTINEITEAIIGSSIEVRRELGPGLLESAYRQCLWHGLTLREVRRELGPGLLESAYRQCLWHGLTLRGMPFVCERPLPVAYKGLRLDCGYRGLGCCGRGGCRVEDCRSLGRFMTRNFLLTCGWVVGKWAC